MHSSPILRSIKHCARHMLLFFFLFFCCEISISQIPEYLDFFYFYEDKHGTNFFPTKEFVKLQFHSFKKLHEMVSQISVIYRTTAFVNWVKLDFHGSRNDRHLLRQLLSRRSSSHRKWRRPIHRLFFPSEGQFPIYHT